MPRIILNEDSRNKLLNKSKSSVKGKQRFNRRQKSKVANNVHQYNSIDMNKLFKEDILTVNISVRGETDDYTVKISFGGFLDILKDLVKGNIEELNLRNITRALITGFNKDDVYISCSCLHPSTEIKLLDGRVVDMPTMKKLFDSGETLYVYSTDENGDFKPGLVEKVWITKQTKDFIKVTLDNGEEILTTPDHLYMLRDGSYQMAENLIVGQSLMPMYFSDKNGYETVKFNSTGKYHSTYKVVANELKSTLIKEASIRAQEQIESQNEKILLTKIKNTLLKIISEKDIINEENYLKYRAKSVPHYNKRFSSIDEAVSYFELNHKIVKIERLQLEETPVYDIKVKDWHNFVVNSGIVLHNCPDFHYRFGYWATRNKITSGEPENRPSNITNPRDDLGSGCKHILLVLNNNSWLMKVASVINNYIKYMEKHYRKLYSDIIYPAIFDRKYEEPVQLSFDDLDNDNTLQTDSDTLDASNKYGQDRTRFQKGNTQGIRFAPKEENDDQLKLDVEN